MRIGRPPNRARNQRKCWIKIPHLSGSGSVKRQSAVGGTVWIYTCVHADHPGLLPDEEKLLRRAFHGVAVTADYRPQILGGAEMPITTVAQLGLLEEPVSVGADQVA